MRRSFFLLSVMPLFLPQLCLAQNGEVVSDSITFQKAKVLEISNQHSETLPGLDTVSKVQTVKVQILDGAEKTKIVSFQNDFVQLSVGEIFYLRHTINELENIDQYSVSDPYRLNVIYILIAVFLGLLFLFGGLQGVRGLASLIGSIVLIFYVLLPGILHGYSPILLSIGVSSLIIIVGSYITHGINKTTSSAVLGMIVTVIITGILAYLTIHFSHLSGYTSEEVSYLNLNSRGSLDLIGLLFGSIMIGLLGVLYDISIGQAVAVEELYAAHTEKNKSTVYKRAIRIGREHIGALVNTLAIAYVGVALPLLLLVATSPDNPLFIINGELFATEIIRILIGSIGLILAVPITTLIAVYLLDKTKIKD